jgi:hypothetical protein
VKPTPALAAVASVRARREALRLQTRWLRRDQDTTIRAAINAGHTPAEVAEAAGLTVTRVHQIKWPRVGDRP